MGHRGVHGPGPRTRRCWVTLGPWPLLMRGGCPRRGLDQGQSRTGQEAVAGSTPDVVMPFCSDAESPLSVLTMGGRQICTSGSCGCHREHSGLPGQGTKPSTDTSSYTCPTLETGL